MEIMSLVHSSSRNYEPVHTNSQWCRKTDSLCHHCVELGLHRISSAASSLPRRIGFAESAAPSCPRPHVAWPRNLPGLGGMHAEGEVKFH